MRIIFIGVNGYQIPYTRVRCYHFANVLREYGMKTKVLSYQEHLSPQYNGVQILHLSDKEKFRLNLKALWSLFRERNAVFYIQKVHYHSAMPFLLSRLGKNRFILDYDDWDIDRSHFFKRSYLNRLFFGCDGAEEITGRVASKAAGCVASSKYLYHLLLRYNKNVSYIPTGADTEEFKPCQAVSRNKITFVWTGQVWGRVVYDNILYIMACFFEVCRQYGNIRLRIIAGGDSMPSVKEYIRSNYPRLDIEVIDWVNPQDMPAYLSDTDIGLLPLIADDNNELWMKSKSPTKLFEYMAMGLPTIASSVGEAEFVIENGRDGFLVRDKEEFIERMKLLIKDRQLRIRMGRLAREKAERDYSLKVLGRRLFDFVSNCPW